MTSLAINDHSDNQKKHILDPVCILFFFPFSLLPVDGNAFERTDCFKKSPLGLIKRFNTQHVQ